MFRCAAFAAVFAVALSAVAGPLDPPKGPISSTSKPLAEVEPRTPIGPATTPGDDTSLFKITAPGSYYLTGNIIGTAKEHGILIAASDVTIDLCGFSMFGDSSMLRAITNDGARNDLVVRNGVIKNWGGGGVVFNLSRNCTVTDVVVNGVGGVGIEANSFSIIRNCSVDNTGDAGLTVAGIQADTSVLIESCRVSAAIADGISTNHDCTVRNCVVNSVGGVGIRSVVGANLIESCTITQAVTGVITGSATVVRNCSVQRCSGDAILANNTSNRIEGNYVTDSLVGLHIGSAGNMVIRNTATGNSVTFEVVADNFGQYILATPGGVVFGTSGGVPLSTDSNANYAY